MIVRIPHRVSLVGATLVLLLGACGTTDTRYSSARDSGARDTATLGDPDTRVPEDAPDRDGPDRDAPDRDAPDRDAPDRDTARPDATSCLPRPPQAHRASANVCDDVRPPSNRGAEPGACDFGRTCEYDSECSAGTRGRCIGNSHDGCRCDYDACTRDDECGDRGVCECGGAFRSDANTCLVGNCRTDSDCDTGYCSPSWGGCGAYTGTVGYFCRTCEDECVDDSDCTDGDGGGFGAGYCAWNPQVGRWACSYAHCAG